MSHGKGHDCLEREAVWEQNDLSLSADGRTLSPDSSRQGPFNHSTFHSFTTNILVGPPFYRRYCLEGTQTTTSKFLFYLFHCVYWLFTKNNFIKQSKKKISQVSILKFWLQDDRSPNVVRSLFLQQLFKLRGTVRHIFDTIMLSISLKPFIWKKLKTNILPIFAKTGGSIQNSFSCIAYYILYR